MKTLSNKIKLVVVALFAAVALFGFAMGASSVARADDKERPIVHASWSQLYIGDDSVENGFRIPIEIHSTVHDKMAVISGGTIKVAATARVYAYVCPTELLPADIDFSEYTYSAGGNILKVELSNKEDSWKPSNRDGYYVQYIRFYNFPASMYNAEITVFPYVEIYDGNTLSRTMIALNSDAISMEDTAGLFLASTRGQTDPDVLAMREAARTYAKTYNVTFYDENSNEVASGEITSKEKPISILSTADQQKGWMSDNGNNGRAFVDDADVVEGNVAYYYVCAYSSFDEEGDDWYDTQGATIFLGNDAKNKSALVTIDMFVETTCSDFALLDITSGVKLLSSTFNPNDYADFTSYTFAATANANGEIVLSVGDWHNNPQRVALYIDNVSYELTSVASRSTNSSNGYCKDFLVIPTDEALGSFMNVSLKVKVDKYTDDFVESNIYTVEEVWTDNSPRTETKVYNYSDITNGWMTINFTATVVNFSGVRAEGKANEVAISGNNIIVYVGYLKTQCALTTFKDVTLSKAYTIAQSSIQYKDGYGYYYAAIPVDTAIASVGETVNVTVQVKIDTYSDQWVTAKLYVVNAITDGGVSDKTLLKENADITDDDWMTVSFTAPVLNAPTVSAYGSNGSVASFTGNYVMLYYGNTKNTTTPLMFKTPSSLTKLDYATAARSFQNNDKYGADVIFIPTEGAGIERCANTA